MKKALITMTALAMVSVSTPLRAGNQEWATAGKVMAGVGAGLLLSRALVPQPVYSAPPVYVNPAPVVVQQPATVVVQSVPAQQVVVQQPVQVVQQPIYVQSAPVIYQPAPVVYATPVYVRPAPVYYATPVVGFNFSFGHHHHHHGYRGHRRW